MTVKTPFILRILALLLGFILMLAAAANAQFTGHAVDQDTLPKLQGNWDVTVTMTFNQTYVNCRSQESIPTDSFNYQLAIGQNGNSITGTSGGFDINENNHADSVLLEGVFLDSSHLSATNVFNITGKGSYSGHYQAHAEDTGLTVLDCNNIRGTFSMYTTGQTQKCRGTGTFFFTRINPITCYTPCASNFTCSDFSGCVNGTQTRLCFDSNQCNRTQTSKTESQTCAMPAPAPAPVTDNSLLYIIVASLALLVAAIAAFILLRKGKKGKRDGATDLASMISNIDHLLLSGDREGALEHYSAFSEAFARYYGELNDLDRQRIYQQGLGVYQKLASQQ